MKLPNTYNELEEYVYNKEKKYFKRDNYTKYLLECINCGEEYFGHKNSKFCCNKCSSSGKFNGMYGKHISEEAKEKIRNKWKDPNSKYNNPEYRKNIGNKSDKNGNWKGGFKNIKDKVLYDTYAPQLEWIEKVRSDNEDKRILNVKCCKCGEWFRPSRYQVNNRIQYLKGNDKYIGEFNFYCSNKCKNTCSFYHINTRHLERREKIKQGLIIPNDYNLYKLSVFKFTRKSYKKYKDIINPEKLSLGRNKYHIDHKYSIYNGFKNCILPSIIGSYINLDILKEGDNIRKGNKNTISKKKLFDLYISKCNKEEN